MLLLSVRYYGVYLIKMNYKLLALGGDGIGPEVLESGLSILEGISKKII